jgi:hypothetical protein
MAISTVLAGVVGLVMYSSLSTTLRLSSQNVVTNMSNFRARQTLDRIGEVVRFAQEAPVLINANGTAAAASTADGIMVKNALGGPYVFKNANGQADAEIPETATSFIVEYAPSIGVAAPQVGDFFVLTLSKRPELEVTSVGSPTNVGSISKVVIKTRSALGEVAKPGSYSVTARRYRKEAYVFALSGTKWNLLHYGNVTGGTNFGDKAQYRVLGTGFQKLNNQAWFTTTTSNGTQSIWLRAVARSSDHDESAEIKSGRNTLTSMPVQIKLWNYNAPPPSAF